jgi:flagella basal body P-ring formation protein FlgA
LILGLGIAWAGSLDERAPRSDRLVSERPTLVSLRGETTVRGPEIRLGEIADIHADDAGTVERLRAVEVGRAPLPGLARTLDHAYLKARLRLAGVNLTSVVLDLPQTVSVITASQQVIGAELLAAIKEYLLAARPEEATRLVVALGSGTSTPLVVPAGRLELKVRTRPGVELIGSVSATVEAWVDGAMARSINVPVRIGLLTEVLAATRQIPRGASVGSEDVRVERRELTVGQEPLRDPSDALGRQATRSIAAGELILASLMEQPPLVRRGDIVILTAEGRGLRAVTQGEAREEGRPGQVIRVRNLTSNREVYGRVDGERSVRIPF